MVALVWGNRICRRRAFGFARPTIRMLNKNPIGSRQFTPPGSPFRFVSAMPLASMTVLAKELSKAAFARHNFGFCLSALLSGYYCRSHKRSLKISLIRKRQ